MIEPTEEEQKLIVEEVKDHAAFWKSDMCKRDTVERHLLGLVPKLHPGRKPMEDAGEKIMWMIQNGKLLFHPSRTGGYLSIPKNVP
jgi:hypothetical protein